MPYSFPILDKKDILVNLAELEIELSEQDLVKPTAETIKPVFEQIVQTMMGMNREELQQPVFSAIDILEFPELHEESIGQLAFIRAVSKLMLSAGVHDFAMKDLYKPEYNRVIRHLSAIINFAKFREEKNLAFQDYQERADALLEQRQQLEEANMQLTGEVKQIESERAAQEQSVQALEAEMQELAAKIAALNKQQAMLQSEVRTLKQAGNEVADKVANEKFLLLNAKQETERLKGEIVESPEKLQRTLEELNATLERERATIGDVEKRSRDLQSRLDCTAKAEREVHKCLVMMQEAEAEIAKYKAVSRSVKDGKGQIAANEKAIALLTAEEEHLRRQTHSTQERLQRLQQHGKGKRMEMAAALEEAKSGMKTAEGQHEATLAAIAEKQKQIRGIVKKMEEVKAAHARRVSSTVAQFNSLYRQVTKYHLALSQVMEDPPLLPPRPVLA